MFKIARKDLKLFLTDKRGVLLTFLLPISLITLFAFIFGGAGGEKNDATPISLLISDLDKTELSKKIVTALDSEKSLDSRLAIGHSLAVRVRGVVLGCCSVDASAWL